MQSLFLSLTKNDLVQACWSAVSGAVITVLIQVLEPIASTGSFANFDLHALWMTLAGAVVAGLASTLKRWLTNSQGKVLKSE